MVELNIGPSDKPDQVFIERQRDRFANRALSLLVLLNGAGAFILLAIVAQAPGGTVHGKVATAMLFFSAGSIFALLSAFLAYISRSIMLGQSGRGDNYRAALRGLAIAAVIGSGAAFLTAMNMVATAKVERSKSEGEKATAGLAASHIEKEGVESGRFETEDVGSSYLADVGMS